MPKPKCMANSERKQGKLTAVKSTELHTPFSNAAESAIRDHKEKRLLDDCMEIESFIRSHTAQDNWQLQGQVPQTFNNNSLAILNTC